MSFLIDRLQYLGLRFFGGFLHCFDIDQNLHTAGIVGDLYAAMVPRHKKRAQDNLRLAFPEWTQQQVEATAAATIRNMFELFMVDSLIMPRLVTPDHWPRCVRLHESLAPAIQLLAARGPVLLLTGHCGNWELLGYGLATLGFPITAIARPLDNAPINDWLLSLRQARGLTVLTKWGATPAMNELVSSGGRVGFIADQNAGDDGIFVPFFGRLASSYKSIGLLAMHHRVPIITGYARRLDERFQYEISSPDIIYPEEWDRQEDPLFYITARYNRAMELMIRQAPSQYLWVHRRWKSRPRFERDGKPFPAKLRGKIEALPWMTTEELKRIVGEA
jgi:Kdo2-lipid IVA lauroyltransferase/acyltransferase